MPFEAYRVCRRIHAALDGQGAFRVLDAEIATADRAAPGVAEAVMMPPSNLERCKPGHANCAVDYEKKKAEDQAENPEVFSVDVSAAVIDG